MRLIDKSKPVNRKCEHCGNYRSGLIGQCKLTGKLLEYWKVCKDFEWDTTKQYKEGK
jgi:hypothetical protein